MYLEVPECGPCGSDAYIDHPFLYGSEGGSLGLKFTRALILFWQPDREMLAYASRKRGGGSTAQSLDYVYPSAREPSASAGKDLLPTDGLILRPKIGGFYPSIMKGVINSGAYVAPLAAYTAKKMMNSGTRKAKKGGASRANQERARGDLLPYGNPSAVNLAKYAKYKSENAEKAAEFLADYIERKQKTAKKRGKAVPGLEFVEATAGPAVRAAAAAPAAKKVAWKNLVSQAFEDLRSQGYKPSATNASQWAARTRNGKNTANIMTRLQERRNVKTAKVNRNLRNTTAKAAATAASLRRPVSPYDMGPRPAFVSKANRWNWHRKQAKSILSKYGAPGGPNITAFASRLMADRKNNAMSFLNTYRTQKAKTAMKATTTRRGRSESPKKTAVPFTMATRARSAAAETAAGPSIRPPADSVEKAMNELRKIGTPKRYHGIALAALRKRGENDSEFLKNFRNSKYGKSS